MSLEADSPERVESIASAEIPPGDARRSARAAPSQAEPVQTPAGPPESLVVLHYRPRHWSLAFLLPGLVVLLGCVILSVRLHTPDWLGLFPGERAVPAHQSLWSHSGAIGQSARTPPESGRDESQPRRVGSGLLLSPYESPEMLLPLVDPFASNDNNHPGPEGPAPREKAARVHSAIDPAASVELNTEPGHEQHADAKSTEEERRQIATRIAWQEIAEEAAQARADREKLARLKPELLAQERRASEQKELESRRKFHAWLRAALEDDTAESAVFRTGMMEFVKDKGPVEERIAAAMSLSRENRRAGILQLRDQGVEETEIFLHVGRSFMIARSRRSGPRNEADALMRAARELLAVPPDEQAAAIAPIQADGPSPRSDKSISNPHKTTYPRSRRR